jgi:agmatinase
MSQEPAPEYLRHGQTPFFRLPRADSHAPPGGTRAAFLGVPTDAGTTYQPGARLAPFHVRRVSAVVQGWHTAHGLDPFAATCAVDAGNVVFPPFDREATRGAVEAATSAILSQAAIPFLVGGDHSIALPALRAAAARHGPLAGGRPRRRAPRHERPGDLGRRMAPRHSHPARARGRARRPWSALAGLRARALGARRRRRPGARHAAARIDADAVARLGAGEVACEIAEAIGDRPTWITFDVDAVDPAFAPGTGTPVPGGLGSREALAVVAGVRLAAWTSSRSARRSTTPISPRTWQPTCCSRGSRSPRPRSAAAGERGARQPMSPAGWTTWRPSPVRRMWGREIQWQVPQ